MFFCFLRVNACTQMSYFRLTTLYNDISHYVEETIIAAKNKTKQNKAENVYMCRSLWN